MPTKKDPTNKELQAQLEQLKARVTQMDDLNIAIESERHERILDQFSVMDREEGIAYYRRLFVELTLNSFTGDPFDVDSEDVRDIMTIFDLLNL